MKLILALALVLTVTLTLAVCFPPSDLRTEGEKAFPAEFQSSYNCSINQWEMVKRRIDVCEAQGWGSKPFEGCPSQAIRSECTWKGQEINDNLLNN